MPSMKKVPPVMASTLKRDLKRKVTEKMLDVPQKPKKSEPLKPTKKITSAAQDQPIQVIKELEQENEKAGSK